MLAVLFLLHCDDYVMCTNSWHTVYLAQSQMGSRKVKWVHAKSNGFTQARINTLLATGVEILRPFQTGRGTYAPLI